MNWFTDFGIGFLLTTIALRLWFFPKIVIKNNYEIKKEELLKEKDENERKKEIR